MNWERLRDVEETVPVRKEQQINHVNTSWANLNKKMSQFLIRLAIIESKD